VINSVNFGVISRLLPHPPKVMGVFVKPWIAALLAIGGVRVLYCVAERGLGECTWLTLAAVALSALLYAITVLLIGAVDKNEIKAFLRPARIANI
jgi:ABC-type Fe3+-siderophore transport system permease subunit